MNFKNLLPYENYFLSTLLPADEVQKRIAENIQPPRKFLQFGNVVKPYSGLIKADHTFEMERNIDYRNSFLPKIEGSISGNYGMTKIHIKMHLNIFALIFITFGLALPQLSG